MRQSSILEMIHREFLPEKVVKIVFGGKEVATFVQLVLQERNGRASFHQVTTSVSDVR